ncbi:unnamed protein product [Rhizoctonia solani]|uniref:AA9 family lytic polysaccharide monooxygenase n=1 Tax=Rhizoctonia solani TaxID=456999 RepID=A0A8H3I046_9AGAM|nr:unnamed protein product [Rhizoctonia solani]
MKFSALAAVLGSASATYAHTIVKAVFINGVDQGNGENVYIRSPPNNNPVKDLASKDVACNVNNVAVPKTLEVSAGDIITFEWRKEGRNGTVIAETHKGPVMVYVASTSSNGEGAVWNKIFEEAYTTEWAVDKLIRSRGHVSVTVPNLEAGDYLFRPEIIALQAANTSFIANPKLGADLYMECIQFKIVSNGSVKLPAGIDFKTSYTYSDQGLVYNLQNQDPKTYVAPGGRISPIAAASQPGIRPLPAGGNESFVSVAPGSTGTTTASDGPAYTQSTTELSSTVGPSSTETTSVSNEPTSTQLDSEISSIAAPKTTDLVYSSARTTLPTQKMSTVTLRRSSTAFTPIATASSASSSLTAPSGGYSGGSVAKYYRCGGIGYTGPTTCAEGTKCVVQNPYYSQCI